MQLSPHFEKSALAPAPEFSALTPPAAGGAMRCCALAQLE